MRACNSAKVFSSSGKLGIGRSRQPRPAALGMIGGNQHLADQRQHVGKKPGREQCVGVDLSGFAIGFRLLQNRRKRLQGMAHRSNGTIVHD